jgi:TonB family protein
VFELASSRRSGHPLLGSLLLHTVAALVLFTLHFTGGLSAIAARVQRVILIAPARFAVQAPRPAVHAPRVFRAVSSPPSPPTTAIPKLTLELPLVPAIELVRTAPAIVPEPLRAAIPAPPPPSAPRAVLKAAGFSSAESSQIAPAHGSIAVTGFDTAATPDRGPVRAMATARASGFGDNSASGMSTPVRRQIASGGFGDTTVAAATAPAPARLAGRAAFLPVEILTKPRPEYSAEARRLRIEGEVLLELSFGATGETRVLRVVRGLGHGLDENAMAAAREIRFRPAQRDGAAVDSAAVVHIIFQLAY